MRVVHFSDTHLGFRQFDRDAKGGHYSAAAGMEFGKNAREADVETAFRALVDQVIELRPDLVIVGGDVFHTFRPSNGCITFAIGEFRRLTLGLPDTPIVIAAGNHDLPRSKDTPTIMGLLRQIGIHVAEWESQTFTFPGRDLSVLAVPEAPGMTRPPLIPNPAFKYNVLVLHGEVHGMPRVHGDRSEIEIPTEELRAPEWSYIGLGHYHVYQQIAPNCFYAGAIEYTSSNPWGELEDQAKFGLKGKGFVERNLETGEHHFHDLPRPRDHVDRVLNAAGMTGPELTVAIRETLDDVWVDAAVVRLVVKECPREVSLAVDAKMLREYRARALNLHVEYRKPEVIAAGSRAITAFRSRRPLEEQVDAWLRDRFANNPPADISLEAIYERSNRYMAQARALATGEDPVAAPTIDAAGAA